MLKYNEVVEYKGGQYVVIAQRMYQSRHFLPKTWMVSWQLSPLAYEGMEHDEEIWVAECDLVAYRNQQALS